MGVFQIPLNPTQYPRSHLCQIRVPDHVLEAQSISRLLMEHTSPQAKGLSPLMLPSHCMEKHLEPCQAHSKCSVKRTVLFVIISCGAQKWISHNIGSIS